MIQIKFLICYIDLLVQEGLQGLFIGSEKKPIEKPSFSYIYELNKDILSSISYHQTFLNNDIKGLLLGPLAVDPKHRGKGFGVELVKYTISLIKKNYGL